MIREQINIAHVLNVLNEALRADPKGMAALIEARVPCNKKLSRHPTIQVLQTDADDPNKGYIFGVLGLLNGLFGMDHGGMGCIAAKFDDDGNLLQFFDGGNR